MAVLKVAVEAQEVQVHFKHEGECFASRARTSQWLLLKAQAYTHFAFSDKIISPFCLEQNVFLLSAHFAQILLSKFCQGLMLTII